MQQNIAATLYVVTERPQNEFMRNFKLILLLTIITLFLSGCLSGKDWRTASRESANIAPDPTLTDEAVIQIYGADAWGWRGWFAIHTWIATKGSGEDS